MDTETTDAIGDALANVLVGLGVLVALVFISLWIVSVCG